MAAPAVSIKINRREFDATLRKYILISKREIPDIINTKAFFIARRAVVETPKAKLGRMSASTARTLGKIINKRKGARGEKGLYGSDMAKAVELLYAARRRSVAFIKSGWLPAIRELEKLIPSKYRRGAARKDNSAKQIGDAKGNATPARAGFRVQAKIINAAIAKRDKKDALGKYGMIGLQRAFDFETKSMLEYIARALGQAANKAGIKTH